MGYLHTKIAQERLVATTSTGASNVDATLIAEGAKKTATYREGTISGNQIKLQDFTNGAMIHVKCTADEETGTMELWGYPENGDAEYLGQYTYTADEMVADDGQYYVDEFVEAEEGQHTVTILNRSGGKAVLKLDTLGFQHIVALLTVVSAGTHKVYLRPW